MYASLTTLTYQSFNGLPYLNCISDSQVVDILDSGRSSVSQKLKIIHSDFV